MSSPGIHLSRIYSGNTVYNLVIKCGNGKKAKWEVESVYRLHGKFLGFMLTNRGIEANPDKCRAVMEMKAPSNKKEVQQLTGRLAALTRFLPKSAEKALPMFRLLKKEASVEWNSKCDDAFEDIKQCRPILQSSQNLGWRESFPLLVDRRGSVARP
ncbi:hypothetical protein K1719_029179 [Acacia pycnantha]|nr:hypothetical protein K1719_029179 [Acacia pycnantha]